MKFDNRLKKELAEGVVRAVFEDAGYRVIDAGVEKIFREVSCLTGDEYHALNFPSSVSVLPDFVLMSRDQTAMDLVEVKYRRVWDKSVFDKIQEQVQHLQQLVLVSINGAPEINGYDPLPSAYLRCCRVRYVDGRYEARVKHRDELIWRKVEDLHDKPGQWWGLQPLQEVFPLVADRKDDRTLTAAIKGIGGILEKPDL